MGWRINLVKKNYKIAKKYFVKAKTTGKTILNQLPTINAEATINAFQPETTTPIRPQKVIYLKPKTKKKRKRQHNIANVSDNYLNNLP